MKRREILAALAAASMGWYPSRKPVFGQGTTCVNGRCYPTQPSYGYPRYSVQRTEDAYGQPLSKGYRYFTAPDGRLVNEKGIPYIDTTTGEFIDAATGNRLPKTAVTETPPEATQPTSAKRPVATSSDAPSNETGGSTESPAVVHGGWTPNPEATRAFIARTPPEYRQQIEALSHDEDRSERLLYRYLMRLVVDSGLTEWFTQRDGQTVLCSYNQGSVGSCTGHATAFAVNVITACEIAMVRQPFEFRYMCSAEAMYGIGRKVAGMLSSRGDGCYVSALVSGCETVGTLYCAPYGDVDLTHYNEQRCREFGSRGVGSALETEAGKHKTLAAVNIENFGELLAAIRNGYPAVFGSNVGYEGLRNEEGVIAAKGTWNHALVGIAIRYSPKYGWLVGLNNSWGNTWNPKGYVADEPMGFWWAKQSDVERMLRDGECFALSGIHGFPRQSLPDMGAFFGGR